VIREALDRGWSGSKKDCSLNDIGPDHYARLTAVDSFIKLLTAAAGAENYGDGREITRELAHLRGKLKEGDTPSPQEPGEPPAVDISPSAVEKS
jgi:hypothetical protein